MRPGEAVRLTIGELDDEGAGVGRTPSLAGPGRDPVEEHGPRGFEVHVAGALPGEEVTARIDALSSQRPKAWASLLRLHETSPARVTPACAAYGRCGGCTMQHLEYAAQLSWKESALRRRIAEHAALAHLVHDGVLAPAVPSPRQLGYRNKSKLVAATAEGMAGAGVVLGAFSPRSHDVVNLAGCAITEAPLDAVCQTVAELSSRHGVKAYDERLATGSLRHVVLRASARGQVLLTLVTADPPLPGGERILSDLRARHPQIVGVVQNLNPARGNVIFGDQERTLWGASSLDDEIGGIRLRLSSRAFFQANRHVAAAAYRAIAEGTGVGARDTVVDAYAGVGGIALTLARAASRVIGIEENPAAVGDATANAAANQLSNAAFVVGDVATQIGTLERADIVVLNPPRKGCDPRVLEQTASLRPRSIAYLSCAPATLLRDLSGLRRLGYSTRSLIPFDMLPHTPHLELLALLTAG